MNVLFSLFRLLTIGDPDRKQLRIRVIGIVTLVVITLIWGLNYRSQTPPSGIRGDTSPTLAPLQDAGTVEIGGDTVTGTLKEGERHTWTFEGQNGQRVNFRVSSDWFSTLEIIPPNGNAPVATSLGRKQAFICSHVLYRAGTYSVVVSGTRGYVENFGDYELRIEEEGYVEERPINYGETVESRLTTCDGDFYTIEVEDGDRLRLTLTAEDGANIYVRLLPDRDSDDMLAISQSVVGEDGITRDVIAVEVLQDGAFFIQVTTPPDQPEAGYTLVVGDRETSGATEPVT